MLPFRAALFAAVLLVAPLTAQTRSIRAINAEGAKAALAAAEAEARKNGWELSIAVVDPAGELVAFLRMDGASFASVQTALGKARTAGRYRRPTQVFDSLINSGRYNMLNMENMMPLEGAVPIVLGGVVVGAIGASGATSAQDAVAARAGAAVVKP